jgi:hypothetical protein
MAEPARTLCSVHSTAGGEQRLGQAHEPQAVDVLLTTASVVLHNNAFRVLLNTA